MKNYTTHTLKLLIAFFSLVIMLASCEYKDVADAEYPDQLIYMPAALYNPFYINTVALPLGNTTPGNNYRYIVDMQGNKFNVPLAVYRSGIDNKGAFKVDISVNTDTIAKLQAAGEALEGVKLLASDKYTIASSVDMLDDKEIASFNLSVKLDSMLANYSKNTVFALGVTISSTDRETNPLLATTIMVIDTKMMKPTADFTYTVDGTNPKRVTFTNSSDMSIVYEWNFGDGSAISAERSPIHTFAATGTYTVTLKALGITGEQDKTIKTTDINIL